MPNAYLIDSTRAEAVTHPLTLAAMQETVGGYITPAFTVPSPTRPGFAVTGYVNDEGILMNLPVTLVHTESDDPLCGPVLICGLDETTGDTTPLDAAELDWIKSPFACWPQWDPSARRGAPRPAPCTDCILRSSPLGFWCLVLWRGLAPLAPPLLRQRGG